LAHFGFIYILDIMIIHQRFIVIGNAEFISFNAYRPGTTHWGQGMSITALHHRHHHRHAVSVGVGNQTVAAATNSSVGSSNSAPVAGNQNGGPSTTPAAATTSSTSASPNIVDKKA
jgi:hypothetical protein